MCFCSVQLLRPQIRRYIVDSSKHIVRLELLIANQELDVFPIFLIRGPEGQICSSLRKNRKYTKLGKSSASLLKLIKRYVGTNRQIHKLIKHHHHAVVRYEELALNPEKTLSPLMEKLVSPFTLYSSNGPSRRGTTSAATICASASRASSG